jgi:hypothetical protein
VVQQVDAGAEGGLEEAGVGGGDGAPLERVEVGGEAARLVERVRRAQAALRRADDTCAELTLPEHGERAALGVVIETGEADEGVFLANARGSDDFIHEVLAVADLRDVPGPGTVSECTARIYPGSSERGTQRAICPAPLRFVTVRSGRRPFVPRRRLVTMTLR